MRIAEELVTMVADLGDLPHRTLRYAMAGAVLLDLALEGRIDSDPGRLWPVDPTPLDDNLLDPALAEIVAGGTDSPETWVRHVARGGDALYDRAVLRLATVGLMELDDAGVASPPPRAVQPTPGPLPRCFRRGRYRPRARPASSDSCTPAGCSGCCSRPSSTSMRASASNCWPGLS